MDTSEANLRAHHIWVPTDSTFQKQCRLKQALWRESQGFPIGQKPNGELLGSRIAMPRAQLLLENFVSPIVRDVVRAEVMDPIKAADKLFGEPRIYDNLLSSQPLCFNLFGELSRDLGAAARVVQTLEPARDIERVTAISFEHSPGRRDARYTADRSAFDVFIEYTTAQARRGFLGVEVKYHEALTDAAAAHRPRYDQIAEACGWWVSERAGLQKKPLQQMWRDHLLAASLVVSGDHDEGAFVFLAPQANTPCARAVAAYRPFVARDGVFSTWTLERVLAALDEVIDTRNLRTRYG
jgi:hypothetical protein